MQLGNILLNHTNMRTYVHIIIRRLSPLIVNVIL